VLLVVNNLTVGRIGNRLAPAAGPRIIEFLTVEWGSDYAPHGFLRECNGKEWLKIRARRR
jgi:hypothetical protein